MTTMYQLLNREWWVYMLIVLAMYMSCLFLNYVVKKMNEAKHEDRLRKIESKNLSNPLTHAQAEALPEAKLETKKNVANELIPKGKPFISDPKDICCDKKKSFYSAYSANSVVSPHLSKMSLSPQLNNKRTSHTESIKAINVNSNSMKHLNGNNIINQNDPTKETKSISHIHTLIALRNEIEIQQWLSDLIKNIKE